MSDAEPVPGPRFSVVIPLEFHRGRLHDCLRAWTREQAYPRERYEVLAAACRHSLDPERLAQVRSLLAPADRLLLLEEPHDVTLCARAAAEARGEAFFFTESHCLPEPETLARADATLRDQPRWAGFSGRSLRLTHNRLSVVEADMYEADIATGMQHPWRRILDQCFVVRREPYRAAGGFRAELGHFAEWHLAARMHWMGFEIGYAPDVRISHHYVGDCDELIEFSADFVRGEMVYQAAFTDDPCRSYFVERREWVNRHQWETRLARPAFGVAWRTQARPSVMRGRLGLGPRLRWLFLSGLRALWGAGPELAVRALEFQWAARRLRLGSRLPVKGQALATWLSRLVDAIVRLEQLRFARNSLRAADVESSGAPAPTSASWRPDRVDGCRPVGFHGLEEWQGAHFRWSEAVGLIEVRLRPGRYRLDFRWLPIKPIERLVVYLDERPVSLAREDCALIGDVEVGPSGQQRLSWTCEPYTWPGHSRLLGVPLAEVSWTAL